MTRGHSRTSLDESAHLPTSFDSDTQYARLPDNANPLIARDTIDIHNPSFPLPNRSLARRRAFQDLQNRYYRQILHGCTNPLCETPTCFNYQKRVSQGPFRPYNVLSARILATFLASQARPFKGLCPHMKADTVASAISYKRSDLKDYAAEGQNDKSSMPQVDTNAHIGADHIENPSCENDMHRNGGPVKPHEKLKSIESLFRDKDTKSFAQVLFDTAAMKSLQLAYTPETPLKGVFRAWEDQQDDSRVETHGHNIDRRNPLHFSSPDLTTNPANRQNSSSYKAQTEEKSKANEIEEQDIPKYNSSSEIGLRDKVTLNEPPHDGDVRNTLGNRIESADQSTNSKGCTLGLHGGNQISSQTQHVPSLGKTRWLSAMETLRKYTFVHDRNGVVTARSIYDSYTQDVRCSPQSLSHFSSINIHALVIMANEDHSGLFYDHQILRSQGRTDFPSRGSTYSSAQIERYKMFLSFTAQSITYVCANIEALTQSFIYRNNNDDLATAEVQSYKLPHMIRLLRQLSSVDVHPSNIISSLSTTVKQLYLNDSLPPQKSMTKSYSRSLASCNEIETLHITKFIFAALIASVQQSDVAAVKAVGGLRACGYMAVPLLCDDSATHQRLMNKVYDIEDALENERSVDLLISLTKAIATRQYEYASSTESVVGRQIIPGHRNNDGSFLDLTIHYIFAGNFKIQLADGDPRTMKHGQLVTVGRTELADPLDVLVVLEWLRTILLKEWDGKAQISRFSAVGATLGLLAQIHSSGWLEVNDETFYTPFLSERLDLVDMPLDWIDFQENKTHVHLLSYPFLFSPSILRSYFRAINYDAMYESFKAAVRVQKLADDLTFPDPQSGRGSIRLHEPLKEAQSKFLVLEIRRANVLADAMDQLWRRQRRELMRPLKVRMGVDEGEEGVDLGGVQQEFFRVAIAEAMSPDYGAFTTDHQTRMSWFRPGSFEPLYKFKLLGILTSLAIYNGLTLPFTFPIAFYRKLLNLPVSRLDDIEDGWPVLTQGLRALRDWPDDNVEEVFSRPYVFSVDAFGTTLDVDMHKARKVSLLIKERDHDKGYKEKENPENLAKTPPLVMRDVAQEESSSECGRQGNRSTQAEPEIRSYSPDSQTMMVTKANRDDYISDYISHLIHHSIKLQWDAFTVGFFTCFTQKSITLFSPIQLKALVEGLPDIDVDDLAEVVKYENGFYPHHPTIRHFWSVVRSWPQTRIRQLLEFVTSSDRLPAGGIEKITFVIMLNGDGKDGRLPTSMTCFGRLLLPAYSDVEKLRKGLETVVEHSKGFGQA